MPPAAPRPGPNPGNLKSLEPPSCAAGMTGQESSTDYHVSQHERRHIMATTRLGLALLATCVLGATSAIDSPHPASAAPFSPPPDMPVIYTGAIDAGGEHTCAVLADGTVRCWGLNTVGQLGYGNSSDPLKQRIGDSETPASAGAVDFGGPRAIAVSAGDFHSCAILDDLGVRCWGLNTHGQLGYGLGGGVYDELLAIGDDETPAAFANVDLGAGRTAKAISAGGAHTCAILDNDKVRCWGWGASGQLGYANENDVGFSDTPASAGYVDLGNGRTAKAIAAGGVHTCAILDNDKVRCWGSGADGRLGYGNTNDIGDDETPASAGYVDLGSGGMTAKALAAGGEHTCVILSNDKVRCWGRGFYGALGYGNTDNIGDDEVPNTATVGHVDIGGINALKITAGEHHTCAILADLTTRCWGSGILGNLSNTPVGDDETPADVDPVDLGSRSGSVAITAGYLHTCAAFFDGGVLCWGNGQEGALGQGNTADIGDNETPGSQLNIVLGGPVQITWRQTGFAELPAYAGLQPF